jgi:hypothetical protein
MKNTLQKLIACFFLLSGTASSYTISGETYLTDGSQADVQSACSAAPDNGSVTVVIPDGTFSWSGTISITHSLTLAGAHATGVNIQNYNRSSDMIDATSSANGHINIYWLNIVQMANNSGGAGFALSCDRTEPSSYTVLVHDCKFSSGTIFNYMVQCLDNGIIFWNDTFIGDGPNDPLAVGGITFVCDKYGYTSSWNTPDTYGVQDTKGLANSYVEDCKFYDAPTAVSNFDDNSRVVWRYNTMQECSLGSHGQETSLYGVRLWEVYNNTFIHPTSGTGPSGNTYPMNMNDWFLARGGSGVVCNNQMDDIPYNKNGISLTVFSINRSDSITCQTGYPAARQTGQGWSSSSSATFGNPVVKQDGTGSVTEGVYIWANTGSETSDPNYVGLDQYTPDECGNGELVTKFLKPGRDYFVGTAKPNWTPHQYPHPLHTAFAVGNPSPTPTPTPRPTPTPTSSPTPTPTPKPTPTPTPKPTPTPTPTPSPTPISISAWENELYAEMRTIGISEPHINRTKIWMVFHQPASSGGSYSAWEDELFQKMESMGIKQSKLAEVETWVQSNTP